jgi:hypothetical protein
MNRKCSALAVAALAVSAIGFSTSNAAAKVPDDETNAHPGAVVPYDPPAPTTTTTTIRVPVDDELAEGLQSSASALGGAGLALGGLWFYRRRQPATS